MFNDELNLVKKQFSRHDLVLPLSHPWYAGRATWARALKKRIELPMKVGLTIYTVWHSSQMLWLGPCDALSYGVVMVGPM